MPYKKKNKRRVQGKREILINTSEVGRRSLSCLLSIIFVPHWRMLFVTSVQLRTEGNGKKKRRIDKNNQCGDWPDITPTSFVHTLISNVTFKYDYFPDNVLHSLVATIFRDFKFNSLLVFIPASKTAQMPRPVHECNLMI